MRKKMFVFGSNLSGRHGAGSAHHAYKNCGALYGCGIGPQGDSYAIPTKDEFIQSMDLERIAIHVRNFIDYAKDHPELDFEVVKIGCGLAGFKSEEIAPMFKGYPDNCQMPPEFVAILKKAEEENDNASIH